MNLELLLPILEKLGHPRLQVWAIEVGQEFLYPPPVNTKVRLMPAEIYTFLLILEQLGHKMQVRAHVIGEEFLYPPPVNTKARVLMADLLDQITFTFLRILEQLGHPRVH